MPVRHFDPGWIMPPAGTTRVRPNDVAEIRVVNHAGDCRTIAYDSLSSMYRPRSPPHEAMAREHCDAVRVTGWLLSYPGR